LGGGLDGEGAEKVTVKQFMRMAAIMAEAGANAEVPEPAEI